MLRAVLLGSLVAFGGVAASAAPIKVVAYAVEPFSYVEDGRPTGLEIEILEYYAKRVNRPLDVTWVQTFQEALASVERGDADVAAATVTITPAREKRFALSAPYFPVRVMLVIPKGRRVESLRDLAGAKIATVRGTVYETLASRIPNAELVYADNEAGQFELLASGRAEALVSDSPVALHMLRSYPNLALSLPLTDEEGFGFACPAGSPLAAELSHHIDQLKASKIYFRLLEKYFGAGAVKVVTSGRTR